MTGELHDAVESAVQQAIADSDGAAGAVATAALVATSDWLMEVADKGRSLRTPEGDLMANVLTSVSWTLTDSCGLPHAANTTPKETP